MPVILIFTISQGARKQKTDDENRINTKTMTLFRSGAQTFSSCRSLGHARGNKSIIFFDDLMQANRNIHLCTEEASIYKLSHSKSPETQQTCGYRHTTKTSGIF